MAEAPLLEVSVSQRSGIGINQAKGVKRGVCLRRVVWCDVCRVKVFPVEEAAYLEARKKENTLLS